jgi:sugar phosphate isomerase/epimerase
MTAKIIQFTGITRLDLPPERVLEKAKEAGLEGVVVLGYTKDGEEFAASSYADGGTVLWLLERTKARLLGVKDEESYR